ncbi:MAG: polyprenyl synthetase family protein [Epsilonproteobacteria bacterium]|nr:polyprenyl synthetase family protein [Campylobacterota bacterium]OIO13697.1 MAG: octaprenyl-diphosphate synthase [Helicobacteraceae bacterium CG1_02_36_14]PIP10652.1 MAG: octaprenyl-diphosphate synthase [Sulfurimonas sp. CG23_combo_of_CG06-09_8_20_14_all_36_33]PIS25625.1 MAG: octaprenyl-diphosphate synthase [Sulfurimonas sp. CG08_land_8_20_14_0_20_36_33]PIU34932.1 MAG: octaprenyl-diphosphate synthase [Sulfurimonas sp. CG07_land_8_20_14_0_80_36_56]PIV04645.1 MAG: octaprenyl-diphosphate synth
MQRVELEIARLIKEIEYDEVTKLFAMLSGGKRLRAKLILKIAPNHEKAPLLAAIVELIHGASLLHDDVIDDSHTRRGVASVNATEGSKTAVMLGDILYSKAFTELLSFDKEIAKCVASSVTALSKGEMQDVKMADRFNSDEKKYLDMLYLKTATLIEAAATASALLAGKDAQKHAVYGRNLGLSFQIIDDILDITSDATTLGKPAMNDFVEGKCTLPYIYLYEALNEEDKKRLERSHAQKTEESETLWIKEKMKENESIEKSFLLAQKLSYEAMQAVEDDKELVSILETMIKRSY